MSALELAIVVIGRNEGERLACCLESCADSAGLLVYVDSGSSDGSVARAAALGASVVELDASEPFTAARARNAGFAHARERLPAFRYVQFVDADCQLDPGWISFALAELEASDEVTAVCGRRRERFPERSPYNQLCDLEWDTPVGEATSFGGDVMIRAEDFARVDGYRPDLIAGEDPELSHRLRKAGAQIRRLDHGMTLHDADMHRFNQWWRRGRRAGHAYAECWDRHRSDNFREAELRSILFWGLVLPVAVAIGLGVIGILSLVALSGYGVLFERVRRSRLRGRDLPAIARLYAASVVVGKWAQALGALEYLGNRLLRRRAGLIEYKAG